MGREISVLTDTVFRPVFRKKQTLSFSINFIVIFTVFDFVNFINTEKSRTNRYRFPYYDTDSNRFHPTGIYFIHRH